MKLLGMGLLMLFLEVEVNMVKFFDKELIPRETESIDKRLTLDNF